MSPDELLERLATTCKGEIGPAVGAAYPRTQAFMTAVVLEKLAGQLRLAEAHARAEQIDRAALLADLDRLLPAGARPRALGEALGACRGGFSDERFSALVAALWGARGELGPEGFAAVLGRVRRTLRARLDRQLAYAA